VTKEKSFVKLTPGHSSDEHRLAETETEMEGRGEGNSPDHDKEQIL
jgi:hypothetical protein